MNTYYEIKAINIDGDDEILFGSFVKGDCTYELQAERSSWKDDGYKCIAITSRDTDEEPDLDVYADDQCDLCGKVDELGHNDATGLALCCKCDNENQDIEVIDITDVDTGSVHFYATCALGWATADTRDAAIRKLVNANFSFFKDSIKPAQKRGDAGAYIWACQVNAPIDAKYAIEFYSPRGVETEAGVEHFVTHLTRKELAYTGSDS